MTEPAALQKLLTWLSPAFPVGAFAWSAGLESAIADRTVRDSAALQNWLEGVLTHGGLKTDAILLAEAWRAVQAATPLPTSPTRGEVSAGGPGTDRATNSIGTSPLVGEAGRGDATRSKLSDLADLAIALTPARERHAETTITGQSFITAAKAWPSAVYAKLPDPCPYPIAVGAIAAAHDIDLGDAVLAYLTAAVHSQISVAVRLVPLGQTDGLKVMAALEPRVAALARTAASATLADIGSIAYATDIAQMRHETLEPRIFRS
jgi:urease accessory protein